MRVLPWFVFGACWFESFMVGSCFLHHLVDLDQLRAFAGAIARASRLCIGVRVVLSHPCIIVFGVLVYMSFVNTCVACCSSTWVLDIRRCVP